MCFVGQLTDIDLHRYYSQLEPQTPTDEEASKKPTVISFLNASFRYNRYDQGRGEYQSNGVNQRFKIGPVTGDIKKVPSISFRQCVSYTFPFSVVSGQPCMYRRPGRWW